MTEKRRSITYADSGVDVQRGEEVARNLTEVIRSTWNDRILPEVAGFKAVYDDGEHFLIGATDGVGTKLLVGIMAGDVTTVGIDLGMMCFNDLARVGAEPLFFLDYLATGKLEKQQHYEIVSGIAEGCRRAGVPLIGGETAELPGVYQAGHFDLAGFAIGRVRKTDLIDGKNIRSGAALLGIESSGIHSNGYSLARKVFFEILGLDINAHVPELGKTVREVLLEPTMSYTKPILDLVATFPGQIQGGAHVTGGGMPNKVPKMLPEGLGALVEEGSWPVHAVFDYLAQNGPIELQEMRKTFNRGIGMVLAVNDQGVVPDMIAHLRAHGMKGYQIGRVVEGGGVQYSGNSA